MTRRARPEGGFTLIEILIALAIGAVVMAGMVQMFRSNREAFTLLEEVKNMEVNARVAMDFMSRDFRGVGRGLGGGPPFFIWDNSGNTSDSTTYSAIRAQLNALAGTDIVEVFYSYLPEPVCISDFNDNNALAKVPRAGLIGLPDYNTSLSNAEVGDLLDQYTVLIYEDGNSTNRCTQNITDGGWSSAGGNPKVNINYNRGVNNDNANRPHDCSGIPGTACLTIGADIYYYVSNADPANPQLMRDELGDNAPGEAIANYVEDFQILFGEDTSGDGQADVWVNGDGITDPANVVMARLSIMVKTKSEDYKKGLEAPPTLENSTIDHSPDRRRHRVITRTVMMRNQFYSNL